MLIAVYVLATAFATFATNFAAGALEWIGLWEMPPPGVFTESELPNAILALAALGLIMKVRDNTRALLVIHGVIIAGVLRCSAARRLAFHAGWLSPLSWMILSGAGLYMAYTPFNAMLFRPMIGLGGQDRNGGIFDLPCGCVRVRRQLRPLDLAELRPG